MELTKNQRVEITIDKIVYGGEGLGYIDGFALFVPQSVPGDRLIVEIISLKKSYGRGIICEILEKGVDRVEGNRVTFEEFHGCDFAMLNYPAQLKYKQEMIEDVIRKVGKVENPPFLNIIGADEPLHYRNKIIEPFASLNGEVITGFFKKKSHEIFQVDENFLNSKLGNRIIEKFKEIVNNLPKKISVYDEVAHKGVLRHIMVRTNSKGEAMVVLIVKAEKDNQLLREILGKLKDEIREIKSVYLSINKDRTNFALGRENHLLFGEKSLKETLFGLEFNISPTSFFQINIEQTKKLYGTAIEFSENLKNKVVVDAYSGTGTIGMILSKEAKHVYAIEIVKSATEDGIKSAKENGIDNITFINGGVEVELKKLLEKERVDTVFLDPPRKGVDEESLIKIANTGIEEIVYISCNPSTLARDIEILSKVGYEVKKLQGVDMFPQTSHVEMVALLVKVY